LNKIINFSKEILTSLILKISTSLIIGFIASLVKCLILFAIKTVLKIPEEIFPFFDGIAL